MRNQELFSNQAAAYSKYRPTYPSELFTFILKQVNNREAAWDCGTGNGQAAAVLADYFEKIFASDISQNQLELAVKKANIEYVNCSAEQTPFSDNSFDLITVAQAYHWFDFSLFKKEATRVGRAGSILAVWSYGHVQIQQEIDRLLLEFHDVTVGPFWDERRKYVVAELRTVPFDYDEIDAPAFEINLEWELSDLSGYLESWSAVQTYIRKVGDSPVPATIEKLKKFWKEGEAKSVSFPLTLRLGKIK